MILAIGLLIPGAPLFSEGVEFTLFEKAMLSGQAVLTALWLVWQGRDTYKKFSQRNPEIEYAVIAGHVLS